jgi:predicted XRE-type DNA-binding protein
MSNNEDEKLKLKLKLGYLVEHWIEHCKEHNLKYIEWADKMKDVDPEIAELLLKAVKKFQKGVEVLEEMGELLKR